MDAPSAWGLLGIALMYGVPVVAVVIFLVQLWKMNRNLEGILQELRKRGSPS